MANSDPLDAFFKKIDRKGNKHKKQAALLTNTEELHKQLVIVTSATTAFKENMDFDDEEDEHKNQLVEPSVDALNPTEDGLKPAANPTSTTTTNSKAKPTAKLSVQDNNNNYNDQQMAGDEWEEFEDSDAKYNKLRLKLSRGANEDENDEEIYSDDENHLNQDQIDGNENRRRDQQQQQQQDKPVWRVEQLQPTATNDLAADKAPEASATEPVKSATTGAYRPPQLRGNSSVTIVSGGNQRATKKEKPNLASTEEFPTLGGGAPKK